MAEPIITRAQFPFWHEVMVRWGDMDAQGHVNHTVYFTYCESARIALLRQVGFQGKQAGGAHGPTLVHVACDFKRQVVYPARLDVGVRVEQLSQRSFKMIYGVFFQGTDELAAVANSVNAWVDYAAERAVALPEWLRTALAEYG